MPIDSNTAKQRLLDTLNDEQRGAVSSPSRQLMVIAGAGSGKTEVMARRVVWWVAVDGIPKDRIVAFTFTEAAAEELKFRIRKSLLSVSSTEADATLRGMFIGTIHAFCLQALREFASADYYMHDVLDEAGRISLLEQGGMNVLGMNGFINAAVDAGLATSRSTANKLFRDGYDQLNEHGLLDVQLPTEPMPTDVRQERDWCMDAALRTFVGESDVAEAFADSAARYYAYLRVRRFFDFSTVQSELTARLRADDDFRRKFRARWSHLVVDEVQDINPVQDRIIREVVGRNGRLTAVGDHRQAIYAFRGGRVDLMGKLYEDVRTSNGAAVALPANYRSTSRIIDIANEWSNTIQDRGGMANPAMKHGRASRVDQSARHVALLRFDERAEEASWIARTIHSMVDPEARTGAFQDDREGARGIAYSDIAILVRSGTDIRTYQDALAQADVPAVVRGGPDLFSQPESLLAVSALAIASDISDFYGVRPGSLPSRAKRALGASSRPEPILRAAAEVLQSRGLNITDDNVERLLTLVDAVKKRTTRDRGIDLSSDEVSCAAARQWLSRKARLRRVFPQQIFHWILEEAGLADWGHSPAAETARFHIGQISKLVKGIETAGWTQPRSLKWQVIAMLNWGAESARSEEAPLLVPPDAVTITTIHSAKGLEFGAVFVADVCGLRFPSSRAKTSPQMPFDDGAVPQIDPARLADNDNYDDERRLMYVAMTRAERYLFVSASGNRRSPFMGELAAIFPKHGAEVSQGPLDVASTIQKHPKSPDSEYNFATSFSDLRYFTECPQDFYMRIVMGYTPTIGQEFGYGRGIHNMLRAVHEDPRLWATLAADPIRLREEVSNLVEDGMFYLRYTTDSPLENLQQKAIQGVANYVTRYADELATLSFEPEKEFETLIAEQNLLVSGAIDVVRLDDPPRVTIVDFKSGDSDEDTGSGLSRDLMALQIGVYGLAARHELEYEPQNGVIRYIGEEDPERAETRVDLSDQQLDLVRRDLIDAATRIKRREFDVGPARGNEGRCELCDFRRICRLSNAR